MTQEDFSQESGRTYIGELERGLKQPTLQKVDELAAPLDVHPLTLLFMAYLAEYDAVSMDELLKRTEAETREIMNLISSFS